jgi:hypothetical protein
MGKYLKKGPKYISSFSKNNKWQYGLAKVEWVEDMDLCNKNTPQSRT